MLITYKNDIKRQIFCTLPLSDWHSTLKRQICLLAPEGLKQFPLFNSTKIGKSNSDAMEN